MKVEEEAVNDNKFNDLLAELNLFNYSLDDINAIIREWFVKIYQESG